MAEVLLAHGADVNARNPFGITALHRAAGTPYEGMIRLLVEHGADIRAATQEGKTPLDYATQWDGHSRLPPPRARELLMPHGPPFWTRLKRWFAKLRGQ